MLLFAISIGVATFIENDFGTSAAQKTFFRAWWFELLLLLFCLSIIYNIVKFRMVQQKKWTLLIFHTAIVIILLGAGITRYFSYEGIMHIRENNTSNSFLSSNTYLKFQVDKNDKTYNFDEPVLFASLGSNRWKKSYLLDGDLIEVELKEFIPNPKQVITSSVGGVPTLKFVVAGMNGREEYVISQGQTKQVRNLTFNFKDTPMQGAFNIVFRNDSLLFKTNRAMTQLVMATQKKDTIYPSDNYQELKLRALYSDGVNNVVFPEFNKNGEVQIISENPKVKNESITALKLGVTVNGQSTETLVYGSRGLPGNPQILNFDNMRLAVSYGSKELYLPFSIHLKKFIMDKYPGTNSASSYASEVVLIDDKNGVNMDFRIFMNNILNYGGYRFFQSSFDKDEQGTYLSVNHDYWGTIISYLGYALLTIGLLSTFFSKKTRFQFVIRKLREIRAKSGTFILLMLFALFSMSMLAQSQGQSSYLKYAVSKEQAEKFSKLVVQDLKGRMKPIHTLSREVMRKLTRKESFDGLDADQMMLSMFANPKEWLNVKIIKLGKHEDILKALGTTSDFASYEDFFDDKGNYKLQAEVRRVYDMDPKDRGVYEKELLKVDERLNILSMVFSGNLLKVIPVVGDPNNVWIASHNHGNDSHDNHIASDFFNAYKVALQKGIETNNYSDANALVNQLKAYQTKNGGAVMPAQSKIKAEIFLNNLNIFNRLAAFYFFLAMAFLLFLFLSVFKPNLKLKKIYNILFALVLLGFALHTIGLGLRWYVSGRAPWSNGYESMIYIAWTTTLAGVLFTRKSFGGLAATMVLASTILLVSKMSFLDPEITPVWPTGEACSSCGARILRDPRGHGGERRIAASATTLPPAAGAEP